ncbi:hypothetical protein N7470_001143 [Penicillium chermesinum]|nr:hypothetical protein N7470_001143 [Penicillium chermesinum]
MDPEADTGRLTKMYSRFEPEASVGFLGLSDMADPTERVILDWFESFCQFCVKLELVTICNPEHSHTKLLTVENSIVRFSRFDLNPAQSTKANSTYPPPFDDQDRICWVDPGKTVGLKVRVKRLPTPPGASGQSQIEETEQYEITLQELLFRTTRFLAGVEEVEDHGFDNRWEILILRDF